MKIVLIILVIIIGLWWLGSWLAIRTIEEPAFTVLEKKEGYEIRKYEPMIVAETTVNGEYDNALEDGFRTIADYIFGNNTRAEKIAMTTPVAETSEKIAMTTPVLEQGDTAQRVISFVMPSSYTLANIPQPNSNAVALRELPERKVAVLRYGWYTNEKRVKQKAATLLEKLSADGFTTIGTYASARYNPPFSIPFILRNEILVEVK